MNNFFSSPTAPDYKQGKINFMPKFLGTLTLTKLVLQVKI